MRLLICLALLMTALPVAAFAQQPARQGAASMPDALAPPPRFLARDLAAICEAADGTVRQTGCLRYLQGAVAMYDLAVGEGQELTWFCAPREAPAGLLRQQFSEWARENADQGELDASHAVRMALADGFPCQE